MLKDQQMLKEMIKIFKYFELTSEVNRRNIRQMVSLFMFCLNVLIFISHLITLRQVENVDEFTQTMILSPATVHATCSIIIVVLNKRHILSLIESLNDSAFESSEAATFFTPAARKLRIFRTSLLTIIFLSIFGDICSPLLTGKFTSTIWFPEAFTDTKEAFYIRWAMQIMRTTYYLSICYATCNFPLCSLIAIENYAKFMRMKLKSIKDRSDIVACINHHLKLTK